MTRYRLTENDLRRIIQQTINEFEDRNQKTHLINLFADGISDAHLGLFNVSNKEDLISAIQQGRDYAQSDPNMWGFQRIEVYSPGKGYIGDDWDIEGMCKKLGFETTQNESRLREMIRESVYNELNEVTDYVNNDVDYSTVGQTLATIACYALMNDKQKFVPCVDAIVKAYLGNNTAALQVISNSFIQGLIGWVKQNKPKFYQGRQQNI